MSGAPLLASILAPVRRSLDSCLLAGFAAGAAGEPADAADVAIIARERGRFGFVEVARDVLTPPDANRKLAKSSVPTFGLTLAHADISGWELCPWRGACTDGCVNLNGNGTFASVHRAWRWRTSLLATHPGVFARRVGWELGRAVRRHGRIAFRPNVNSDLAWHRLLPAMGALSGVTVYGYTKSPAVLSVAPVGFRLAYSWNERSNLERVRRFVADGGRVAVVTDRRPGDLIGRHERAVLLDMFGPARVVDADASDEWMMGRGERGVIGALAAKGRARSLIGRSAFIVQAAA